MNVIDILKKRGFVENTTHQAELDEYVETNQVTCYVGFDPTASSLHVGSLIPIMALAHMQRSGHRPIALVGGGTGLVGDPSGKTELRKLLTLEDVEANARGIRKQLSRYIDFTGDRALLVNNADWLTQIHYIPFLRDIGRHFSVNRMLRAESYKMRLDSEEGLNFIEFNYMLLQAYDFLHLFDTHGCRLQMGGADQWGNIVAGIELVRRIRQGSTFGVTFPLITTSSGAKMGKTATGAVWLDAERTSPYDYYQFWMNTDDRDVMRFLSLFTFLPMEEIREIERLEGAHLNNAKAILAFETTGLAHGHEEATKAFQAAIRMFGNRSISKNMLPSSGIHSAGISAGEGAVGVGDSAPAIQLKASELREGIPVFKLFQMTGLAETSSAARRLIDQGGAYVNDKRIESYDYRITPDNVVNDEIVFRAGKKRYRTIQVVK